MIASFFRSLERERVAYLLISGQAAVLYGAASFSEDLDLWLAPTAANRRAFLRVLVAHHARYYKLTPPFTLGNLRRGHGFHFRLPALDDLFLDVLGRPPRVPGFARARARASIMATDWGRIPTVGIGDLVELKKTQRLADYPVIGRLVARQLHRAPRPSAAVRRWALANLFTIPELLEAWQAAPPLLTAARRHPVLGALARQVAAGTDPQPAVIEPVEQFLTQRLQVCQRADRAYWRDIIGELRTLRADHQLMPEGAPVILPTDD